MEMDVVKYSNLINKYVSVKTLDSSFDGFLDAVDPVSQSIIISKKKNDISTITLITGHSVVDVATRSHPEGCSQYIPAADHFDPADVQKRKTSVHKWLLRNLLPVQEIDGTLQVHDGYLVIKPPYRSQDCFSSNSIILGRVQHLLANIPEDLL